MKEKQNGCKNGGCSQLEGSYLSSWCEVCLWISRRADTFLAPWGLSFLWFFQNIYIYIFLSASVAYQFIFLCISKWHEWNSGNLWASLTEIIVNKTLNQAFLWIARMFTTTIKWSSQIMVSSHSYSKASKGKKIIFRMYNMSALVCFNMQHHDIILMCWTCDLLLIWFLIL